MRSVRSCVHRMVSKKFGAFASNGIFRLNYADCGPWQWQKSILRTFLLALTLCNCSAAPVIDLYSADYRNSEAWAGDSQLLLNILRARDDVPIHFADLAIIHGSIQLTASGSATFPFANLTNSTIPSSVSPTVSAASQPTFDVGTLDTQDFTKGMLSPVDPKIIKQLFDQGVDPRLIMLLFFSEFENPNKRLFFNNTACDTVTPGTEPSRGCLNRFYGYLNEIDNLLEQTTGQRKRDVIANARKQLQANVYVALRPLGGPLTGPWTMQYNLTDLRQLDPMKYKIIGKQVYAISEPRLAICYEEGLHHDYKLGHRLVPLFPLVGNDLVASEEACTKGEVVVSQGPRMPVGFSIRSSYEILQFLGQVLRFQAEHKDKDRCLTLAKEDRSCTKGEVLFQVNAPVGRPVVGTRYGDGWYALYDRDCNKDFQTACDYSLEVLAILELLLNANKSAKDIPSTPRVQVVP